MAQSKLKVFETPAWFWQEQSGRNDDGAAFARICHPAKAFISNSGEAYTSMDELAKGLCKMPRTTFLHHANSSKNDFSVWIADVFGNRELAAAIKQEKNPVTMAKHIERHTLP